MPLIRIAMINHATRGSQSSPECRVFLVVAALSFYPDRMNFAFSRKVKSVAVLAVVSALILMLGAILRPKSKLQDAPPSEMDIARLTHLAQRRSFEDSSRFFAEIADGAARSIVYIPSTGGSGVIWGTESMVTARPESRFPPAFAVRTSNSETVADGTLWTPNLPVAGARMNGDMAGAAARRSTGTPPSGDWVVAVWRTDGGRAFAPGHFQEASSVNCGDEASTEMRSTLVLTPSMAGGGVFTLDGNLMGLILPCGDHYAAIAPDRVDAMLMEAGSFGGLLRGRYGLAAGAMSDEESAYFGGLTGVLVREVWEGHSGEKAGIRPGDIITSLNGTPVTQPADLHPLTAQPDPEPSTLSIRRHQQRLTINLSPDNNDTPADVPVARSAGIVMEAALKGYTVESVIPGSRAGIAGIRAGDRLLRIGSTEPRSADQVRLLLDATNAPKTFVELERGKRRLGVLLPGQSRS